MAITFQGDFLLFVFCLNKSKQKENRKSPTLLFADLSTILCWSASQLQIKIILMYQ